VAVVGVAQVGVAGGLRGRYLLRQRLGPFGPAEQAAPVQRQRHGEGLRLPGLGEHRLAALLRHAGQQRRLHAAGSR
jgi:hypothetical protein